MAHGGGSRWRCAFIRLRERVETPDTQESHWDVFGPRGPGFRCCVGGGVLSSRASVKGTRRFIRDENEPTFPRLCARVGLASVEFCGARAETERFTILRARPPDPERATEA